MTEEMKAKDATRYVVLALHDMEQVAGPLSTEGEARKAAEAQALANPTVEFGIYQKVFTSKASLTVETVGVTG